MDNRHVFISFEWQYGTNLLRELRLPVFQPIGTNINKSRYLFGNNIGVRAAYPKAFALQLSYKLAVKES